MKILRCGILLQFAMSLALGQLSIQAQQPDLFTRPEAMVRSLYSEVIARHPIGIPDDEEMKIFAPYLSKGLLHRIQLASACSDDWFRQNPDRKLKPPFAWLESGLFSGDYEQASPGTFEIEETRAEKDGSFRVHVRLTLAYSGFLWNWQVAVLVVRENGSFVVDDVVFLKDEDGREVDSRVSEYLSYGCDGRRWVGTQRRREDNHEK